MKFLPIIWRNLLRRKVRTIFTIGAIFVAFLLFGILVAVRAAFSFGVDLAGADRLMVLNRISIIQPLPYSYGSQIRQIEGVKDITHANWFGGYFQETRNQFPNMAVEPESWLRMYPEFEISEEAKKAWLADRSGAIVGVDTARRFGWRVGDRVPLQATIFRRPDRSAWEFNIVGIYDSPVRGTDKTQLFFHWDYLDEALRSTELAGHVGWYVIKVADPDRSPEIAKKIDTVFGNSPAETKTDTEKAFVAGFAKQMGNIALITQLITAAALIMILLVSAITMAQAVRERTSELAVLKTLGFGDGRILGMVLTESCAIAILGGMLGLLLSWVAVTMGGDFIRAYLPTFFMPARDLVVGAVLVIALGIIAGSIPAWNAGRLRIVDALRRT
jgi:putative ABC transport system permease protein